MMLAPPLFSLQAQDDRRGRFSDERRRIDTTVPFSKTGEIALEGNAKELASNPEIQAAYLGG